MDFLKDIFEKLNIEREHYTHAGAFVLGVFLTFGLVAVDSQMNTTDYRKSGASSVVRSMDEVKAEREEAQTEELAKATTTEEVEDVDEGTEEELVQDEPEVELIVEGPAPAPQAAEEVQTDNNSGSQAAAQQALEQAQELLADLTAQQQESQPEPDEDAVYTTPSGLKIDANGNVINGDGSTSQTSSDSTSNTAVSTLPSGVYQLPNGDYVYADGRPYNGEVSNTTPFVQENPNNNHVTLSTGMVIDRITGAIISLPPKKEEELIPPTTIDPNNLPTTGSTINIPQSVKMWAYNNPNLACSLNFYNNDRELCNLFQASPNDYNWVAVKEED